ncbi:hypothetical protein [uncultured Psychroserpens sp.]|uniref:hypothetical protein n=1 Tax=uncultured Psychroserpens sp. TaxID=255436 RepID=UPI0026068919|nr:hypothetical protein [uncultured Psychroserpens sp.]
MEKNYCPTCSIEIEGNYCSECGTKGLNNNKTEALSIPNWRTEKDFDLLIKNPKVHSFISHFLENSKRSISAEVFLERADLLIAPLTSLSVKRTADIIIPIYKNLGVKTGRSSTAHFDIIIQELFIKILCSLAKNNYPLVSVEQADNGIVMLAEIPSDFKTFGGDIIISLQEHDDNIKMDVDAKIKGQLIDWGKSKSVIKNIYKDIEEIELKLD